ncbi:MAG: hypothetical protein CME06_15650 [Gemmatimonadetes bacterium]|nr:hypothetical protein [Gemmatimonadota bacterium]
MSLISILRLAAQEIRLVAADRGSVVWLVLMPLIFTFFFGSANSPPSGEPAKIALTLVDESNGPASRAFVAVLEKEEQLSLKVMTRAERDAASASSYREIVIPETFDSLVAAGEQASLQQRNSEGSNDEADAAAGALLAKGIARFIGGLIGADAAGAALGTAADTAKGARAFEEAFRASVERPEPVRLNVHVPALWKPLGSGFSATAPGMLVMFVLMNVTIIGGVQLATDRRTGRLRRLGALPIRPTELLAGRVLGSVGIGAIQVALLVVAGQTLFGVNYGASLFGVAIVALSLSAWAAGLGLLAGSIMQTDGQVGGATVLLVNVMSALSGCWWPIEVMPRWLQSASLVLPPRWAMDALLALTAFGEGWTAALPATVVLFACAVVTVLAGARTVFRFQ